MILVLDIGKTNKKAFVFGEDYRILLEKSDVLPETVDEDGEPCENLDLLTDWVLNTVSEIANDPRFPIRAVNCTAYGASFVHLDAKGKACTPLYNYLKPFPEDLKKQFFDTYGGEEKLALETASPVLGNLNSGLQLYRLKYQKPLIFRQISWSLHLPQYVAALMHQALLPAHRLPSTVYRSEITSIGCHTMLWDFRKNDYHNWVKAEGIVEKFPPLRYSDGGPNSNAVTLTNLITPLPPSGGKIRPATLPRQELPESAEQIEANIATGSGLHDSSAALIPYLASFSNPFMLISTGTWCISLNPFNEEPLTPEELAQDCLCYLTYTGKPVKAARYFGGYEHEQAVKNIAARFGVAEDFYKETPPNSPAPAFEAYRDFMRQLIEKQVKSTRLALGKSPVRRIFVDGGFSKNAYYMQLLANQFPETEVYAAELAQATALGAALAIRLSRNPEPVPENLISLKRWTVDG